MRTDVSARAAIFVHTTKDDGYIWKEMIAACQEKFQCRVVRGDNKIEVRLVELTLKEKIERIGALWIFHIGGFRIFVSALIQILDRQVDWHSLSQQDGSHSAHDIVGPGVALMIRVEQEHSPQRRSGGSACQREQRCQ